MARQLESMFLFRRDSLEKFLLGLGVFSFFTYVLSPGLVTTNLSFEIVFYYRFFAFIIAFLCAVMIFLCGGVSRFLLVAACIVFFMCSYALFFGAISGAVAFYAQRIFVDGCVVLVGVLLMCGAMKSKPGVLTDGFLISFSAFALCAFVITWVLGGVVFSPFPKFVYEFGSEQIGREENYSLLMTNFYVFSAVSVAGLLSNVNGIKKFFVVCCLVLFLFLAFLSGGRGELLIGIALITMMFLSSARFLLFIFFVSGFLFFLLFEDFYALIDGFAVVDRFSALFQGDLSSRDVLIRDAINLLANNPVCFYLGCGVGFFQYYYGYDFSLYPHNSVVEAVLIFGFPLFLLFFLFCVAGLVSYTRKIGGVDIFVVLFIYAFLVSLKSGDLMGSSIMLAMSVFFVAFFLSGRGKQSEHLLIVSRA